jgi:hypothetical protein
VTPAELHAAAFGDRPDLDPRPVPPDPASRWLAAVTLGGQGHYAAAAALLGELIAGPDRVLAALAGATLAAHRRQLGGHAAARPLDAAALGWVVVAEGGLQPAGRNEGHRQLTEAAHDALLGLAADALGLGRFDEARRLLARAPEAGWRGAIRLGWVTAEVELGAGHPEVAVPAAEDASGRATASGAVRHRIKSALVLGVALAARGRAGDRRRAGVLLDDAAREASSLGLLPLVWPCALVLAELEPANAPAHLRRAGDALHTVLRRADPAGRRIARRSPWVPDPAGLTG